MTAITTPTTPSSASYRLLYRGALSLPDSNLTLDGITFCARIDTPSKNRTPNGSLLKNSLALALESMRGRPTLRFVGTVRLSDTWMDKSGGLLMDIHPNAILTRVYFENIFCLGMCADQVVGYTLSSKQNGKAAEARIPEVSELGVKIALGDSDDPETTHMVVFAKLEAQDTIRLVVARLTTQPSDPHPRPRLPRPDDPIPRKPPLALLGSKGLLTGTKLTSGAVKKQKLKAFKVPDVPENAEGKRKSRQMVDEDVFGLNLVNGEKCFNSIDEECEVEKTNKNMIKKTTLDFLAKTKDPGRAIFVNRSHPEFKEIFQWVYRGVSFALRSQMKDAPVGTMVVKHLVKTHVEMYVSDHGSPKMEIRALNG